MRDDVELFVLAVGEESYFEKTLPTIRAYAERTGVTYHEVKEADYLGKNPKFTVLRMMKEFLAGNSQYFYFIDADVFIQKSATLPGIKKSIGWMATRADAKRSVIDDWKEWTARELGVKPGDHIYRNTGVIWADRAGVQMFLDVAKDQSWRNSIVMEQHQFNTWMVQAESSLGLSLPELTKDEHAMEYFLESGPVTHFAGGDKLRRISEWKDSIKNQLPDLPEFASRSEEVSMVFPVRANGSGWFDWELRLALRSIQENWKDRLDRVVILSSEKPPWLNDEVEFRLAPAYRDALAEAAKLEGRVIWMNDDLAFLKPTEIKDLVIPRHQGKFTWWRVRDHEVSRNGWRKRKAKVARYLAMRDFPTYDFSTHTPYLYDAEKMRWLLKHGPWFGYKTPFEFLYFNIFHGENSFRGRDVWRPHSKGEIPERMDRYRFWNLTDSAVGSHVQDRLIRGFCRGRFPHKSRYEH